jgi:hypothetical protein
VSAAARGHQAHEELIARRGLDATWSARLDAAVLAVFGTPTTVPAIDAAAGAHRRHLRRGVCPCRAGEAGVQSSGGDVFYRIAGFTGRPRDETEPRDHDQRATSTKRRKCRRMASAAYGSFCISTDDTMADHPRKLIRAAAVAALIGTAPNYATSCRRERVSDADDSVQGQRTAGHRGVHALRDRRPGEPSIRAARTRANLELAVEGALEAKVTVDDDLDALAFAIENAMEADDTLGGTVSWVWLKTPKSACSSVAISASVSCAWCSKPMYYTAAPPEGITIRRPEDRRRANTSATQDPGNQAEDERRQPGPVRTRMFLKPARRLA